MQKVVGFFSKPENLFVLTLLIGLYVSILGFLGMYIPFLG